MTRDVVFGALLTLGLCGALAALLVPRWRLQLVAAAAAALGAAAALFTTRGQQRAPDTHSEPQRPASEVDRVPIYPDPSAPIRVELDEQREALDLLPDDDLRRQLDDYDRRAQRDSSRGDKL